MPIKYSAVALTEGCAMCSQLTFVLISASLYKNHTLKGLQ